LNLKSKVLWTVFSLSLLAAGFFAYPTFELVGKDSRSWQQTLVENNPDKVVNVGRHDFTVEWWTVGGEVSTTRTVDVYFIPSEKVKKWSGNPDAEAATVYYYDWGGDRQTDIYLPQKGGLKELYLMCGHEKQHAITSEWGSVDDRSHRFGFRNTMGFHPKCYDLVAKAYLR